MRRLVARLRSERGFTLVEVLVAASVGSLVMIGILDLLDGSLKQSTSVNARIDSTQRGRVAMESITRELRSQVCFTPNGTTPAVSLTYADPYKVTFYAFNGTTSFRPDRRTLFWDTNSDSIKETVEPGVGTPVTSFGTPATRTIATNIKPPPNGGASGPVFEYYRTGGTQLSTTPLSAANLPLVGLIRVRFKTNTGVAGNTAGNVYTSYESKVFVRTADPNGLAGSTDPDCT
jgi:prepilin-type N-terminal cleavage/methylation domain-containing protein